MAPAPAWLGRKGRYWQILWQSISGTSKRSLARALRIRGRRVRLGCLRLTIRVCNLIFLPRMHHWFRVQAQSFELVQIEKARKADDGFVCAGLRFPRFRRPCAELRPPP